MFYFSLLTVVATWLLLLIGGIVNPMGASLACPDWYFIPTCNGELLPEMTGGVLFEHGHRLWASAVGLLTVVQCALIFAHGEKLKSLRKIAIISVLLVALQGTLGGATVLVGLSSTLSSLHLLVAMAFFCLLIRIAWQLSGAQKDSGRKVDPAVHMAFGLVFAQIVLGGIVRHLGAGLACGNDWMSCGPELWPSWHLGQLHMIHRILGYSVCAVLVWSNVRFYQAYGQAQIAFLPSLLVLLQIGLGLVTVASARSVPVVVAHTAVGALVLASQYYLMLKAHTARAS